jgi:hypothetical protein
MIWRAYLESSRNPILFRETPRINSSSGTRVGVGESELRVGVGRAVGEEVRDGVMDSGGLFSSGIEHEAIIRTTTNIVADSLGLIPFMLPTPFVERAGAIQSILIQLMQSG